MLLIVSSDKNITNITGTESLMYTHLTHSSVHSRLTLKLNEQRSVHTVNMYDTIKRTFTTR